VSAALVVRGDGGVISSDVPDFAEWVAARGDALARTAYMLCGDRDLAEDLAQTALVQVYRRWDRLDHSTALDAYARTVLVHAWSSWWRRVLRRETSSDRLPEGAAVDDDSVVRLDVLRALNALPKRQRAAVVLRYLDDLSEADTAAALGCSVGTVKSQTSRALVKLHDLLGAPYDPTPER
jgi:RNA polymerase sigma-70 factor (ECF subfamily)